MASKEIKVILMKERKYKIIYSGNVVGTADTILDARRKASLYLIHIINPKPNTISIFKKVEQIKGER